MMYVYTVYPSVCLQERVGSLNNNERHILGMDPSGDVEKEYARGQFEAIFGLTNVPSFNNIYFYRRRRSDDQKSPKQPLPAQALPIRASRANKRPEHHSSHVESSRVNLPRYSTNKMETQEEKVKYQSESLDR